MRTLVFLIFASLTATVCANDCIGHIFVVDLLPSEGEPDAHSDLAFYYHKVEDSLTLMGISHSVHVELPITSKTCFSESINFSEFKSSISFGYVFMKPDQSYKVIDSVLTDIDMENMIRNYFER